MNLETVSLAAGPIQYRDVGQGPPVVFVHGLLVSGSLWEPVIAHLRGRYRCIAPDWPLGSHTAPMNPGADLTPEGVAAIIADFLEALDLRDVTLVANDSGGAITQVLMTRRPARVGRVVLTTCDAFEVFPPPLFAYLGLVARAPLLARALSQGLLRVPALRRLPIAYGRLTRRPIDAALLDAWVRPSATDPAIARDLRAFMRGVSPRVTLAAAKRFAEVALPVLVAWTPEDPSFPFALAERLVAALPDARLATIADSYVFSALDQPARVAELVSAFVDETRAGGAERREAAARA